MTRHLILANQTASSQELLEAIEKIVVSDTHPEFVLLVPATPVEDLLDWQEGDSETVARSTGEAAKAHLEAIGAHITRVEIGDPVPVKAIEDELARHPGAYDHIIISTLPIQRSKWLTADQPRRIERRLGLPVTHVVGHSVTMSRQELVDGLNADLNLELAALLRGIYHAAAGRGMLGHEVREMLTTDLPTELEHAMFLADKIVALGGDIHIRPEHPAELVAARQLLSDNIAAERAVIANYSRRIDQALEFGDKGLAIRLEEILAAETTHLEELERLAR